MLVPLLFAIIHHVLWSATVGELFYGCGKEEGNGSALKFTFTCKNQRIAIRYVNISYVAGASCGEMSPEVAFCVHRSTAMTETFRLHCNGHDNCTQAVATRVPCQEAPGEYTLRLYIAFACHRQTIGTRPNPAPVERVLPLSPTTTEQYSQGRIVYAWTLDYINSTDFVPIREGRCRVFFTAFLQVHILDLTFNISEELTESPYCLHASGQDAVCAEIGGEFPTLLVSPDHNGAADLWFNITTEVHARLWLVLTSTRPSQPLEVYCGVLPTTLSPPVTATVTEVSSINEPTKSPTPLRTTTTRLTADGSFTTTTATTVALTTTTSIPTPRSMSAASTAVSIPTAIIPAASITKAESVPYAGSMPSGGSASSSTLFVATTSDDPLQETVSSEVNYYNVLGLSVIYALVGIVGLIVFIVVILCICVQLRSNRRKSYDVNPGTHTMTKNTTDRHYEMRQEGISEVNCRLKYKVDAPRNINGVIGTTSQVSPHVKDNRRTKSSTYIEDEIMAEMSSAMSDQHEMACDLSEEPSRESHDRRLHSQPVPHDRWESTSVASTAIVESAGITPRSSPALDEQPKMAFELLY